jgi:hypothetical protein
MHTMITMMRKMVLMASLGQNLLKTNGDFKKHKRPTMNLK